MSNKRKIYNLLIYKKNLLENKEILNKKNIENPKVLVLKKRFYNREFPVI